MIPDCDADSVIERMLAEWGWLTAAQRDDLRKLSDSLKGQDIWIAFGALCARATRFAVENRVKLAESK